ncbi:MAG TPA: hypothetical protein DGG94_23145 [Micromonosporaceae bacterium]|nr:hypothetical protein [Micromonosporaceae bacterium]HCU52648.1 hypothetical protein [Micromonosporaceae bacterium]
MELVNRYIALWNEPDPDLRRRAIEDLWTADGLHILQPPQEIRDIASKLGFPSTTLEAQGYAALEFRVTQAYDEFIAPGQYGFRLREGSAIRLRDVVKLEWEMFTHSGGEAVGGGVEVLMLDENDRITSDYQFPS